VAALRPSALGYLLLFCLACGCLSHVPDAVMGNYTQIKEENAALVKEGRYSCFRIELSECRLMDAESFMGPIGGMEEARREGIYRIYHERNLTLLPRYDEPWSTGRAIYFLKNGSSFLTHTVFHDGEPYCERHSDRACAEVELSDCSVILSQTFPPGGQD